MDKSEKILKVISDFIENGLLTSQDVKKQLLTNLKFKKEDLVDKLELVQKEEFEVLKKIVEKQTKEINKLKRKKSKR
tara:strand:- start:2441 stop:2671 length:231 start_codon:yes stop_codon:yes gene_type:complete